MTEWYFPITLLPGVGLLIMSTSNLSMGLSAEIASLLKEQDSNPTIIKSKIKQLSRLNLSLTAFYVSSASLVISGILGGASKASIVFEFWSEFALWLSIICIFAALILLMVYSALAVRIKQKQFEERL